MQAERSRRAVAVVRTLVLAGLPWAWFAVRDGLGLLGDVVAIVLPVLVVVVAVAGLVVARWRCSRWCRSCWPAPSRWPGRGRPPTGVRWRPGGA